MPFLASFHIHQGMMYRQVCSVERASVDVRGPPKRATPGAAIHHTGSLGLSLENEEIGLGNIEGSLQLSDFMIITFLCILYSIKNHGLYFA